MRIIKNIMIWGICFFVLKGITVGHAYDSYIVKYKNNDEIRIISEEENNKLISNMRSSEISFFGNYNEIEYIEPNYDVVLYDNETDKNWNIDHINATSAWEYGCYGNEIKIAILDSGLYTNSTMQHNVLCGYNVINNSYDVTDTIGHGTLVSSIISNESNNEYSEGIAKKAKIIPIKCFDKNYTTKVDKIAEALEYAINVCDCDVINMSFGLNGNSLYLKSKIDLALEKGKIIVAAVGNDGTSELRYPASYDGVIGVGAVDKNNAHCSFSQHNNSVDVVAPGKDINGFSIEGYTENSGTSFSAPHVSAAAAISLCIDDSITSSDFLELISNTSTDLGGEHYDEYYGYGLLNIEKLSKVLINRYKYFMSPINIEGDNVTVTIINNTNKEIDAILINAEYLNSRLEKTISEKVVLSPNSAKIIENKYLGMNLKCFLWNGIDTLVPLFKDRSYN